jgi:CheY-like chemotaxis protein
VSAPLLLVVEDDPDVREALAGVLHEAGYLTSWAEDGGAAIVALRRGPRPAAILLDLMMPGMDGYDFRAEQRSDPAIADIPIILLSAVRGAERAAATLEAAAFLPKPAPIEKLLAVISRVAGEVS